MGWKYNAPTKPGSYWVVMIGEPAPIVMQYLEEEQDYGPGDVLAYYGPIRPPKGAPQVCKECSGYSFVVVETPQKLRHKCDTCGCRVHEAATRKRATCDACSGSGLAPKEPDVAES